jgi:adhesin transport system outer membrane protein
VKRSFIAAIVLGLASSSLCALTLEESVKEVLGTNPIVQERLKNYRATQQDMNIAESEYYPRLDFRATAGYNNVGEIKDQRFDDRNFDYTNYETSLTLTQNLFDGFGTMHKVDYQEARILAAAYNYLEKANDVAFQMSSAYINVLKAHELLQTAKENVAINESIFAKVKELYDSGLTTDSEVKKIQASLSLAKSNLTVQKNNTKDAEYTFRRVLGRMPNSANMQKPTLDAAMPESIERAAMYAIEHNPSLLVSNYNIKGAQALYKQKQKEYYPKIDLEVSQFLNDVSRVGNGFDQPDDRFRARIVLSYNLFKGGADVADVQKHLSTINQEVEIKRDLKRQVIESLDFSWNAYEMIELQLKDLREYKEFAEITLELNQDEYDLGRRTLLDLLSAQNDVINARTQIISAEYDYLFAKYRILDAMGLLVMALTNEEAEYLKKVNLSTNEDAHEILDTLPVQLDVDNDMIADDIDLCDNSLAGNNIMPYGCKKIAQDSDKDGVPDAKDACESTPLGVKVTPNGCRLDGDMDGVYDEEDQCTNTPIEYTVDVQGCPVAMTLHINFESGSTALPQVSLKEVDRFVAFMQNNPEYKAHIIGHTDDVGAAHANKELSQKRALSVRNYVATSVDAVRLSSEGRGEEEPMVENDTPENRYLNRRVAIELARGETK